MAVLFKKMKEIIDIDSVLKKMTEEDDQYKERRRPFSSK